MNNLSPQRRRVVVLAASIACLSGTIPILLRGHPRLAIAWIVFIVILLAYTISELVKLKRSEP